SARRNRRGRPGERRPPAAARWVRKRLGLPSGDQVLALWWCIAKGAVGDRQETGGAAQRLKQGGIGAGQPSLALKPGEQLEQRLAACGVEMGGDFVEQQDRRFAAKLALQAGLGQHDRDQERLLLAGRGLLGGDALLGMDSPEVGAVRTPRGAAGERAGGTMLRQAGLESIPGGER